MEALHGKQITPEGMYHKSLSPSRFVGKLADTRYHTVTWAQRSSSSEKDKNHVFLTISVPDVSASTIKLDLQPTYLDFQGYSDTKKGTYAVKLEFYAEIDPSASKINHTPRDIEMVLVKKELGEEYWPRLLKEKGKVHFLKTDFDKVRYSDLLCTICLWPC